MKCEITKTEEQLKSLILNTCNVVGCKDCGLKWEKDSDGNSCRSDYLVGKISNDYNKEERLKK